MTFRQGSYGTKFKEDARRYYGSFVGFAARGEMIPNENCYADLDPAVKDQCGIPVLRFHWKWSDHEINQALHAEKTFAALIEAMGGTVRGSQVHFGPATRHRKARQHHSRSRRRDHRRRREKIRLQRVEPDLGREEPVPVRRCAVRVECRQKPHADDHGPGLAGSRPSCRRSEERKPVNGPIN